MPEKRIVPRGEEKIKKPDFLPLLFGKDFVDELKDEDNKLELFEKGLSNQLSKEDTIEQAVQKIVKMALAAEFGLSFVKSSGADTMIETILHGIMSDSDLRKQALILVDRFAK